MVELADCLDVVQVEEQFRVAPMLDFVVRDSGLRMMPIALDDDALAALTGEQVSDEGLPTDAVLAAPTGIFVECAVGRGFRATGMRTVGS
ncbi:hypothetical protein [Mesorhizobium sp. IMUNJ 23232]|uniref:hypothetical protein n=1 Tax=Mesorhizobium sp. IMUNJ 23232 TaxID=3376064 RepID=UPI0037B7CF7F